jgi:hypothetical protein
VNGVVFLFVDRAKVCADPALRVETRPTFVEEPATVHVSAREANKCRSVTLTAALSRPTGDRRVPIVRRRDVESLNRKNSTKQFPRADLVIYNERFHSGQTALMVFELLSYPADNSGRMSLTRRTCWNLEETLNRPERFQPLRARQVCRSTDHLTIL